MKNPRITVKERNLLKGAIRRVFSRSDLRKQALEKTIVPGYHDPARPRVTKWSRCTVCAQMNPTYLTEIDHMDPIVPVTIAFADMSLDTLEDNIWCELERLQGICKVCHKAKTKAENKLRRQHKKTCTKD